MTKNRKRATLWALGALLVCSIPLAARVWLDQNGALEREDLGAVGEFILRDERDAALNRDQLRRSVSIVIFWPGSCGEQQNCSSARGNVAKLERWVNESLKPKWTEEKNPLNLLVVGEGSSTIPKMADWRVFPGVVDPGSVIPLALDLAKPHVVVIDNNLLFSAAEPLAEELNFARLERVLSKTAFDQYLGNYLSGRTFMGPRRHQN
jgi:hypothetical protein